MNFNDLNNQVDECINKYNTLKKTIEKNTIILEGEFILNAVYNEVSIFDIYTIKIEFEANYPNTIPIVYELSNKIPKNFQHKYSNNKCCLGVDGDLFIKIQNMTVSQFLETILTHFLFSASYFLKYGYVPFGEREHGGEGIVSFYKEYFNVDSDDKVVNLLFLVVFNKYRGHALCPCKSGIKLRNCHGDKLLKMIKYENHIFKNDLYQISVYLKEGKS